MIGLSTWYAITSADYGYFQVKWYVYIFHIIINFPDTKLKNGRNEDFCLVRMFMKFEEYLIFDWYMVFLRNIFSIPTQARIAGNILHTMFLKRRMEWYNW